MRCGHFRGGEQIVFKNRSNAFEIIAHLLSLSLTGIKKTHLMYQTNLCSAQFCMYLECLVGTRFIEPRAGNPQVTV